MLTNIEALEYWLSFAETGSEIVFAEDVNDPNRDLPKLANESAAFAKCHETLKRPADGRTVYLSVMDGRCIATKLPKPK